jgi:hypothetical protein
MMLHAKTFCALQSGLLPFRLKFREKLLEIFLNGAATDDAAAAVIDDEDDEYESMSVPLLSPVELARDIERAVNDKMPYNEEKSNYTDKVGSANYTPCTS